MIHSLKYLRSPTIKCKDTGIRKSEFVSKTQFLYNGNLYKLCLIKYELDINVYNFESGIFNNMISGLK